MRFLQAVLRLLGLSKSPTPPSEDVPMMQEQPKKYHCIRFMTERGEQVGMLLTHEEFEIAVNRWVQNVTTMPISEEVDEEGII